MVTRDDYARAERLLSPRLNKLILNTAIEPHWLEKSDRFWYLSHTTRGKEFVLVDPTRNTRQPAFDHERLAAALSQATSSPYRSNQLPFDTIEFDSERRLLRVEVGDTCWACDLETYRCSRQSKDERITEDQLRSPDGHWVAYLRDHNIHARSLATGEQIQLTTDGQAYYDYGTSPDSNLTPVTERLGKKKRAPSLTWSPDSRRLVTCRLDQRNVPEMYLIQSVPPPPELRPVLHAYRYPLVGENIASVELVILDLDQRAIVEAKCESAPVTYGTPIELKLVWWSNDSQKVYFVYTGRGEKTLRLYEIEPNTGTTRMILEERGETYVEPNLVSDDFYGDVKPNVRILRNGEEIIWFSERDGWGHLYLYDGVTGLLKRQITFGEWVVREVLHVDEESREIYFTAGGREKGRDPYYRHLYRINIDDDRCQPELLTSEDAEHDVHFSPSGKYFVDTYSRVNTAPLSVLRNSDGKLVRELERADVEPLLSTGWKWPEPFSVKARDGATDIYGVIYRPSNFDSSRKYPVIDDIYPGPYTIRTPKAFDHPSAGSLAHSFWHPQALAELGFIVVTVDGLGTAYRSKAFHDFSYGNLEDAGGLEDHMTALRQLAERYSYMDLNRVGIFGHSAGGYASTRAILAYPDFYKVAVSSAGDHDVLGYLPYHGEKYQGLLDEGRYAHQANATIAHRLKGKLLLAHGDMDDNVHPALTIQLIDALIKANKDFDLIIMPNQNHEFAKDPYFIRRRWDYFVEHLLGTEPPKGYEIHHVGT